MLAYEVGGAVHRAGNGNPRTDLVGDSKQTTLEIRLKLNISHKGHNNVT